MGSMEMAMPPVADECFRTSCNKHTTSPSCELFLDHSSWPLVPDDHVRQIPSTGVPSKQPYSEAWVQSHQLRYNLVSGSI